MDKGVVFVVGRYPDYVNFFKTIGYTVTSIAPQRTEEIDLMVFAGGQDINPMIYGEKKITPTTPPNRERDGFEQLKFREARTAGIPMFGICRGAQFLTAMSGGKLVQHITNHNMSHLVRLNSGKEIMVTSDHHQMMLPGKAKHEILAVSSVRRSDKYLTDKGEINVDDEYEALYFPKTKSLAVQWHPEWVDPKYDQVKVVEYWLKNLLRMK